MNLMNKISWSQKYLKQYIYICIYIYIYTYIYIYIYISKEQGKTDLIRKMQIWGSLRNGEGDKNQRMEESKITIKISKICKESYY